VTRIDPGVVSRVAELRGHERQAVVPFPLEVTSTVSEQGQRPRRSWRMPATPFSGWVKATADWCIVRNR
jgi:hypothetical protein